MDSECAGKDHIGQAEGFVLGEAHVIEGFTSAPPALGVPRALRFGCQLAAIRDLIGAPLIDSVGGSALDHQDQD